MVARPTQSGPWINDVRSLSQSELEGGQRLYTKADLTKGKLNFLMGE